MLNVANSIDFRQIGKAKINILCNLAAKFGKFLNVSKFSAHDFKQQMRLPS